MMSEKNILKGILLLILVIVIENDLIGNLCTNISNDSVCRARLDIELSKKEMKLINKKFKKDSINDFSFSYPRIDIIGFMPRTFGYKNRFGNLDTLVILTKSNGRLKILKYQVEFFKDGNLFYVKKKHNIIFNAFEKEKFSKMNACYIIMIKRIKLINEQGMKDKLPIWVQCPMI